MADDHVRSLREIIDAARTGVEGVHRDMFSSSHRDARAQHLQRLVSNIDAPRLGVEFQLNKKDAFGLLPPFGGGHCVTMTIDPNRQTGHFAMRVYKPEGE